LESSDAQDAATAVREIIRNEERFPSLATMLRYVGEADREKGLKALAVDCRHMAKRRKEPYEWVLRGRLEMAEENLDLDDDFDRTWHEQAEMCRELLYRETGERPPPIQDQPPASQESITFAEWLRRNPAQEETARRVFPSFFEPGGGGENLHAEDVVRKDLA